MVPDLNQSMSKTQIRGHYIKLHMRKKTKEDQILNLEGNRNTKNQKQIQWKGFLFRNA